MRWFSNRSVLYRYLITYIGVAIAACSIAGTVLFTSAIHQLITETHRAEQVRLDMSRDDLSNSLEIMDKIAIQISTGMVYQPFYLSKGPINRMTMLESFQRYQNYSPLIEQYYLYYPETDTVFTPSAEYRFYLFARTFLGMEEEPARQMILSDIGLMPIPGQPEKYLLFYPLIFRQANSHSYAYLLFQLDMNDLADRFSNMYMLSGPIQVTYRSQVLHEAALEEKYLESKAELTQGTLILRTNPSRFDGVSSFRTKALLAIILVTVAVSVISAVIAWGSYLPIRKLASRLDPKDRTEQNEMKLIEAMMKNLSAEKQVTMEQLTGSLERITLLTALLRKQIILQLLSGRQEDGWKMNKNNCGMILDRPFLCILFIRFRQGTDAEALLESLERNATADIAVYGVILPQQEGIAAILSANEDEELSAFCRTIQSSLFNEGFEVTARQGRVVNQLTDLSDSFCSTQTAQDAESRTDTQTCYDARDLEEIRQALKKGDRDKAQSVLDSVLADIMNNAPSMLMQRYYIIHLTYQLVSAGREIDVFLPDGMVRQAVMAENSRLLCDRVRMLLVRLFDERTPLAVPETALPEKSRKIMGFIAEHAFNYTMCLDLVAAEFDISTKQVSRVVRSACGETFKDYLLRLRMEKAIQLLKEGSMPDEVAKRTGYTDERYFKKRFYEYTGESVMRYQAGTQANH